MDADWLFVREKNTIVHATGFEIIFEGEPESQHFSGSPRKFPRDMSNLEVVLLVRNGFDFYRRIYNDQIAKGHRPILSLKAGRL